VAKKRSPARPGPARSGGSSGSATATRPKPSPNAAARGRRAKRTSSWWWIAALGCVVAIGVGAVVLSSGGSGSSSSTRSAGDGTGALLASTASNASGGSVDGIECLGDEQLKFHNHAHLTVFVNGVRRTIPAGIGINPDQTCLYWLHSHTPDGVIHMESPVSRTFTLGNYFDIWGQALGSDRVGPAKGTVTAFVDGKKFTGDPRDIRLDEHTNVQLDVGKVVPFENYTYGQGL
jgi:hypothetical protein